MGVFLRHGKPVKSDSLAGLYSNPVFPRVFEAQDRLWESSKTWNCPERRPRSRFGKSAA